MQIPGIRTDARRNRLQEIRNARPKNPDGQPGKDSVLQLTTAVALLPPAIYGIFNFGLHALLVLLSATASAVFFDWLCKRLTKQSFAEKDFSPLITGLLTGLCMPAGIPLWIPVIGSAAAILLFKHLFGGYGCNYINPAAGGVFLLSLISSGPMHDFSVALDYPGAVDSFTGATSLKSLSITGGIVDSSIPAMDSILGDIQGTIGETSAIAILMGLLLLLGFRVTSLRIPLSCVLSFAVFTMIYMAAGENGFDSTFLLSQIFGGGLLFGACFMATDPVTSPKTPKGQLLYGCILGILTGVFRFFGPASEGCGYAILIGNLLVPVIEKLTERKRA